MEKKKSPVALITGLILLIYAMVLKSHEAAAIPRIHGRACSYSQDKQNNRHTG